jgi:transcriptional regulator with GAF, ATPase, and Fis domain
LIKIITAPVKGTAPAFFTGEAFEEITRKPSLKKLSRELFQLQSLLSFPFPLKNGVISSIDFYSRRPDTYNNEHIDLLHRLQATLTMLFEETPSNIDNSKKTLPPTSGKDASTKVSGFEGIVGNSHLLYSVFDQVSQVAPFDTAVLILGESGTGKERIADCIHHLSPRKKKPFVKVNCAALPSTLIESELFGHEKGSFTGATDKKIGKFEQANGFFFLSKKIV